MVYESAKIEDEVLNFWEKTGMPRKITAFNTKTKKKFYLLDGPPYANARAHVGGALTVALKDVWGKFKTMQGYDVWWQPGFDCHGLPIENKVEKEIGITAKADIVKYGTDKFIEKCRAFATTNLNEWMKLYKKMAAWKGWVNPYFTYDDSYIESGWWTVKRMHERGLLYRGTKPIHWCPHCGTALSGYEVTDSYAEVEDPAVYVKFRIVGEDASILVWTTTPWTLPSNVALLVHPEETYVRVKTGKETLILAKALVQSVMAKAGVGYTVLEEFKGSKLEGLRYEPLIGCPIQQELQQNKNAHRVYVSVPLLLGTVASKVAEKKGIEATKNYGHIVTMDVGTGIVHIAPGHGSEDNKIGEHYKLPAPSPLDDACHYTEGAGFTGFVKDADPKVIGYLEKNGRLFFKERIRHNYPLCWRCKSPLIFRLSTQWFLSIDTIKEKMLKSNEKTRWLPDFAQERMRNHLLESPDWCISTQRFWGIPLPIWSCSSCQRYEVLGSRDELDKRMKKRVDLSDLHKNVVDAVELHCTCGGTMKRVPDVLNVWFDSGIGPWASLGYPYKNKTLFETLWNVDLVDESQDQIRGWFYYLLFMGMATFGEAPYKTACLNGWILDARGEKMSKSLGNVVDAAEAADALGADVLRLYLCTMGAPWGVSRFSQEEAAKLYQYMNVLLNLKNFVEMYGLRLETKGAVKSEAGKWILSRVSRLTKDVTNDLETFYFHYAGRKLSDFILNDFSRTYMKLAKDEDPEEVGRTVGIVLDTYLRLLAPFCPYVSEYLYQELFGEWKKSVHQREWPEPDPKRIDEKLEGAFDVLNAVTEAALALRQDAGIGLRYPIKGLVVSGSPELTGAVLLAEPVIKKLVNVKEVRVGKAEVSYDVKLNYALVGPKYGKDVKNIEAALKKDSAKVIAAIAKNKPVKVEEWELLPEELKVVVTSAEGKAFGSASGAGVVVLDTTETADVVEEAFIRELSRGVQDARKKAGLQIRDSIELAIEADARTRRILEKWEKELKENTGAKKVDYTKNPGTDVSYKDHKATFSIKRVAK